MGTVTARLFVAVAHHRPIVMAAAGMAEHLAAGAAKARHVFMGAIPGFGALGAGSARSARVFSTAIVTAATHLGANPLIALAGQNVTGLFAIIISLPRIALAAAVSLEPGATMPRSATLVLGRLALRRVCRTESGLAGPLYI